LYGQYASGEKNCDHPRKFLEREGGRGCVCRKKKPRKEYVTERSSDRKLFKGWGGVGRFYILRGRKVVQLKKGEGLVWQRQNQIKKKYNTKGKRLMGSVTPLNI